MNREIKFRAFYKRNQKMYEVLTLDIIDEQALIENNDNPEKPLRGYVKMTEIELMQYTGLKDKNGVEIYEGDIVRADMDFGPGGYAKQIANICWDEVVGGWQFNYFDKSTIEIIGNIHDNPELMEVEDENG